MFSIPYKKALMLRKLSAVLLIVAMVFVVGCARHTHKVGHGAVFNRTTVERQWYILYGLVPINDIDTQMMAEGKRNYEITTQITPVDYIYHVLFSPVTITCRTVKVTR